MILCILNCKSHWLFLQYVTFACNYFIFLFFFYFILNQFLTNVPSLYPPKISGNFRFLMLSGVIEVDIGWKCVQGGPGFVMCKLSSTNRNSCSHRLCHSLCFYQLLSVGCSKLLLIKFNAIDPWNESVTFYFKL